MHGSLAVEPASRLHNEYYQDARQNLERVEISGNKIGLVTVQAWALISIYEFKQLLFTKAWISSGRASRFAQMIGIHRLGSHRNNLVDMNSPLLEQPEQYEESCQTLACVFLLDRFTSMGTGLPMVLLKNKVIVSQSIGADISDIA
jgi:Fungal specific transcription factor domain